MLLHPFINHAQPYYTPAEPNPLAISLHPSYPLTPSHPSHPLTPTLLSSLILSSPSTTCHQAYIIITRLCRPWLRHRRHCGLIIYRTLHTSLLRTRKQQRRHALVLDNNSVVIQRYGRVWLARKVVWKIRQRHVLRNLALAAVVYVEKQIEQRREQQRREEEIHRVKLETEMLSRLEKQWQEGQKELMRQCREREEEQRERERMEEADNEGKAEQLYVKRQGLAQGPGLGTRQGLMNDDGKLPSLVSSASPRHRREAKGQGLVRQQGLGPEQGHAQEKGLAPGQGHAPEKGLAPGQGLSTPVIAPYLYPTQHSYNYGFSPFSLHGEPATGGEVGVGGICVSGSMGEGFVFGVSRIAPNSGGVSGIGSEAFDSAMLPSHSHTLIG